MSENKGEQQAPLQVSPSRKEEENSKQGIKQQQQQPLISSIKPCQLISSATAITTIQSPQQQQQQQHQHQHQHREVDGVVSVKRPRFSPNPRGQWKLVPSPCHHSHTPIGDDHSSPTLTTTAAAQFTLPAASSSDTCSSSPSHSPILSLPANSSDQTQQQLRKGKYVSPVWKPHEMLWLARAWRIQYQAASGSDLVSGRAKTRADKDREVAHFLKTHGVNRDAKTAGTKWDNMLGEFRKVYEWERGGDVGKTYFRLSPYERKIHRLPASFDEDVFDELSQFMPSRIRSSSLHPKGLTTTTPFTFLTSFPTPQHITPSAFIKHPPPLPLREDDSSGTGRTRQLTMGTGTEQPYLQGTRATLLGFDQPTPLEIMAPSSSSSSRELRRIGRIRMTWEESVSLWADEEGERHRGRVKLQGSSFLNADELTFFDDSMVASAFDPFTDGPLKGFSVDKFVSGQHLKVLGRRKPSGSVERLQLSPLEPPTRSIGSWEISDPTDYYLGCLRVPALSLPTLYELSWHIQDPPPEDLRFPLRKDFYRDLPQGKELFTTSSNDLLDSKSFVIELLSPLIRTPTVLAVPTSRDSYIALWDDSINRLVSRFCPLQMALVRKPPNSNPDLRDEWPNVTGFVNSLCVWRGEETDKLREGIQSDPSISIVGKLLWSYGDLPYILGYHVVAHVATFCALSLSRDENKVIRTDLYSLDLSIPSERMKALVPCWRIACLLPLLAERINSFPRTFSDFARLEKGVEMTPRTVTRFYSSKEIWSGAKEVYDVLDQQVPYTEHVTRWSEPELSMTFTPRGFKSKPKSAEELVEALKHVTKALVALHDLCFMHRDLSWEKVLRRSDKGGEWVLCGFEEMVTAPQINNPLGCGSSGKRAPEMGRSSGVHGVKVDVWGIGFLVRTSGLGVEVLPKQLKELESKCLDQNPEHRPTAADCYHHLLQFEAAVGSTSTVAVGDNYGG